jgi:hypothetical protein
MTLCGPAFFGLDASHWPDGCMLPYLQSHDDPECECRSNLTRRQHRRDPYGSILLAVGPTQEVFTLAQNILPFEA